MATMKAFTEADFIRVTQAAVDSSLQSPTMVGFQCESSTSATLTVTDQNTARTLYSALPMVAGQWYPCPARLQGKVTITVGGTGVVVVYYNKD